MKHCSETSVKSARAAKSYRQALPWPGTYLHRSIHAELGHLILLCHVARTNKCTQPISMICAGDSGDHAHGQKCHHLCRRSGGF